MNPGTQSMGGALYIVATPIGNLGDITMRARQILAEVDLIAAEDTRHSRHLLQHYAIKTSMISMHEHNESSRAKELIERIEKGQSIALISDAGTPLINDPGFPLVKLARESGTQVFVIPGPCALTAALSVSGLAVDRFAFEGFLPGKPGTRRKVLEQLVNEPRTMIFYESPHRIRATIADMLQVFGPEHRLVIAKELTKQFETVVNLPLVQVDDWFEQVPERAKGEFVLLLAGVEPVDERLLSAEAERTLEILLNGLSTRQAADFTAKITGASKNKLYQLALTKKTDNNA